MNNSLIHLIEHELKEREGIFFDEFMNISENDMTELYPETMVYCDTDTLGTRKAINNAYSINDVSPEEKKERERESYLKYKEFVMKKKGHKGGFRWWGN